MRRLALALLSLLLATALCTAQQLSKKLTNKDVIEMADSDCPMTSSSKRFKPRPPPISTPALPD
jgi:hypothetical protein